MRLVNKYEIVDLVLFLLPFLAIVVIFLSQKDYHNVPSINSVVGYTVLYLIVPNNAIALWRYHELKKAKKNNDLSIYTIFANLIIGFLIALLGPEF